MNYGYCTSQEEFVKLIYKLYEDSSPMPDKKERQELMFKEMNLIIDHRLGCDFPEEKRQALWKIKLQTERRLRWYSVVILIRSIFKPATEISLDWITKYTMKKYSEVFSSEEMKEFFNS